MLDLHPIKERLSAASQGPWRAMRDGNQYVGVELDGRKGKNVIHPAGRGTLVGASHVEGLVRPWNPWWVGDSTSPETQETVRLKDADADFVAAAPRDIAALIEEVERLRISLRARESEQSFHAACR